ncbi:MAG: outer membrane beta-barrel protein [Betaproteobacteria bacterium]
MRRTLLVVAIALLLPGRARAEWQLKPFLGLTFGGGTTFVDFDQAAGHPKLGIGVSGLAIGDVLGVEADFGHTPGFFQRGSQGLVADSGVTTLTGNVVAALPRRMSQYTLRPYVVGGAGLMHVTIDAKLGALTVARSLPALDLGGGVTGFLTDELGVSWEVRYFRSFRGQTGGASIGPEQLSFWRANMALAIRF